MGDQAFVRRSIRWLAGRGAFDRMPDEEFLKLKYWACMGKKLDLANPRTFNEKLQWIKLHDRKPEYSLMVDKFEAKKYAAARIGEEYIIPTLGVWERFDDIDFSRLPDRFVLKCTHDSGGIVICRYKAAFDVVSAKDKIERSLRRNYYLQSREWPYKDVEPRIIAEQYLEDAGSDELTDYKIWCFSGEPRMILVCTGRFGPDGLREDFFDCSWTHLDCRRPKHGPSAAEIGRPDCLPEMLSFAEKLAGDLPFVRIDFYQVNGQLKFGEITFFPASGFQGFVPEIWDERMGSWISLE